MHFCFFRCVSLEKRCKSDFFLQKNKRNDVKIGESLINKGVEMRGR